MRHIITAMVALSVSSGCSLRAENLCFGETRPDLQLAELPSDQEREVLRSVESRMDGEFQDGTWTYIFSRSGGGYLVCNTPNIRDEYGGQCGTWTIEVVEEDGALRATEFHHALCITI
jgi:hypothetical protein